MKYMIMLYGSQRDYDQLTGAADSAWDADDVARLHQFMGNWNQELVDTGEFVEARGLAAPVHACRVELRAGVPVVTDGPYAETQEVLAGYTIVECNDFERATQIAAKLAETPHPPSATLTNEWHVDVRPIDSGPPQPES